jgi:hypothetical protein
MLKSLKRIVFKSIITPDQRYLEELICRAHLNPIRAVIEEGI